MMRTKSEINDEAKNNANTRFLFIGGCSSPHPCDSRLCYGKRARARVLLNVLVLIRLSGDTRERRAAASDRTRLDLGRLPI